jgi:hypothetical protein
MFWGPKCAPQGQKHLNLGSRLRFFSGPRTGKEASPIIFLGNLGCTLAPQTTRSALVSVWGSVEFFARSTHFSVSRYSETSTRYSKTSNEKTLVFRGLKYPDSSKKYLRWFSNFNFSWFCYTSHFFHPWSNSEEILLSQSRSKFF